MIALSIEIYDGENQFFMPPNDHSLKVDGTWVDPGMMGDGIPRFFDRIGELCASLGVQDFQEFVLSEDLQMEIEELQEELEELEEEENDEEEIAKLKAKIVAMQPWQNPADCLITVRALIADLESDLVPDPEEPGGAYLPDSLDLPRYLVWQLRTYEKILEEAEAKRWSFYFEIMS